MKHHVGGWIAIVMVVVLAGMPLAAQEKQQPSKAEMDEMTKRWQEAMTPGAPHKVLESMAGEWVSETKVWMAGPDAPPAVSKGTSTMKMVLGGRFLQHEMTGEMMGMPMMGIGLMGYDNVEKKHIGSWVDNTSTAIYRLEGSANAGNTEITYTGKLPNPETGKMDKPVKWITRILGKDKHTFEMYDMSMKGKGTKVMEIVYERKK
jgi:hypothetical protein